MDDLEVLGWVWASVGEAVARTEGRTRIRKQDRRQENRVSGFELELQLTREGTKVLFN